MSKASFKRIDYSLRPAKHAERRMLNEIFRRLSVFCPLAEYRYVGMGSLWFSDFTLYHRSLGIKDMLSIERDTTQEDRFNDNKPFNAIRIDFRDTSSVLPTIPWDAPAMVWLDYDGVIENSMLSDVGIVARRAVSGSMLAITVQCHRAREIEQSKSVAPLFSNSQSLATAFRDEIVPAAEVEQEESGASSGPSPVDMFRQNLGTEFVPPDIAEDDLLGWPFGEICRQMFSNSIEAALAVRNLGAEEDEKVKFKPVCSFEYEDGIRMTTLVGMFAKVSDDSKVRQCKFEALDFLQPRGEAIRIEIPVLTLKEIRLIERQLPNNMEPLVYGSIPQGFADKFARFYRYLPNFAVLEQ